jgi:hypothetical protein
MSDGDARSSREVEQQSVEKSTAKLSDEQYLWLTFIGVWAGSWLFIQAIRVPDRRLAALAALVPAMVWGGWTVLMYLPVPGDRNAE